MLWIVSMRIRIKSFMWIRMRIHIQGVYDPIFKFKLTNKFIYSDQKLKCNYPYASRKEVHVTGEASSTQMKTSSTKYLFFLFLEWKVPKIKKLPNFWEIMLLLTIKKARFCANFCRKTVLKYCLDPEPKNCSKVGTGTAKNHYGSTTLVPGNTKTPKFPNLPNDTHKVAIRRSTYMLLHSVKTLILCQFMQITKVFQLTSASSSSMLTGTSSARWDGLQRLQPRDPDTAKENFLNAKTTFGTSVIL